MLCAWTFEYFVFNGLAVRNHDITLGTLLQCYVTHLYLLQNRLYIAQ
jgi:hypothetical protein